MNEEQVSESDCSRAFCERNQEGMKAALIYVADPLGLVIMTDGDGDGDVKSTTPAILLHHVLKLNHPLSPPHHPSIRLRAPLATSSHLYM
jgi:hypothetical protein